MRALSDVVEGRLGAPEQAENRPKKVLLRVASESQYTGGNRRRVRAEFNVRGTEYLLAVTHPDVGQQYLGQPNGEYDVSGSVPCISLADFFYGNGFKLVRTVITP